MIDILKYIDEMQVMYGDKEPSSMDQEPRTNYSNGLSVDPERDSFKKISNVLGAYKRYRRGEKNPKLNFNQFFELYSTENFAEGGQAGQLVQPNDDGSRPGYSGDKFLVKVGDPKKVENVIEQKFIEVIGSKNRPETYKKTGVERTLYKPQIIVGNKTVLTTDFGSKDAATASVKKYREKNPIKNAPPDLDTLDKQKKKKYLGKRERSAKIIEREGVERFATGDDIVQKGHAQNINNPDVPIKPRNIIYTPKNINQSMAGQGANISPTDLDFKIDVAEDKMKDIKKSNMSKAKKKTELGKVDTKLMKYVAQSDGYKTVTLSDGQVYGEIFQKEKSMDMFNEFPNMTEKETKKFVNQYFNDEGKLKDKWTKGNVSSVDKANIKKSYVFLENIKNAKSNAKKLKKASKFELTKLALIGCSGKGKADGGRIGFNDGQNLTKCATEGVTKLQGDPGKLSPGDQANLRALAKSSKAIKFLKGVLGPGAIITEVLYEGGAAANKFFEGMPIKQALGESYINKYLLGPKTQIDLEAERAKEMAKGEEYAMAERGRRKAPFMAQSKAADELRLKKREQQMEELYPSYTDQEINELYTGYGRDPKELNYKYTPINFPGDTSSKPVTGRDDVRDFFKIQDQTQNIADAGGVANMAGGGIAGLSGGDPEGAMTKSMNPDSQGLRSLFNNGKKR